MDTGELRLVTAVEFAQAVGLSDRQVRRLMRSGHIRSLIGDDRIARIPESEIQRFLSTRGRPDGHSDPSVRSDKDMSGSVRPPGQTSPETISTSQLLPMHELALRLLEEERQERQDAQAAARRLEGQLLGLQHTLQSYQRALTENAESIAERESLRQIAEQRAKEALIEGEQIQSEHEAMLEKLKLAHERVSWLEERMNRLPRWVRRWLGASSG